MTVESLISGERSCCCCVVWWYERAPQALWGTRSDDSVWTGWEGLFIVARGFPLILLSVTTSTLSSFIPTTALALLTGLWKQVLGGSSCAEPPPPPPAAPWFSWCYAEGGSCHTVLQRSPLVPCNPPPHHLWSILRVCRCCLSPHLTGSVAEKITSYFKVFPHS